MENNQLQKQEQTTLKGFFARDDVKNKFKEVLGERAGTFTASVLTISSQNQKLRNCEPQSIYMCAMMAASLNLQIHPSLGEAYIIPYGSSAQFQIGYKGLIQLALRSGQFKTISTCPIYEGQLKYSDPLKGFEFDFTVQPKADAKPIGYAAYFSLMNGFEKVSYSTVDEVLAHAKKFSKTFANGPWKTDFDTMAQKTVLKMLISRYAPRSVDMQRAVIADQAVVNDVETMDVDYVDEGNSQISYNELNELFELKQSQLLPSELKDAKRILENKEEASYTKLQNLLSQK